MKAKISYEKFVEFAKSKGVEKVTEDEFNTHVKPEKFANLSLKGKLIRIKNDRKGRLITGDREHIKGFAVGSRDFVYDTLENAKSQFISVLEKTKKGQIIRDYTYRGKWGGEFGAMVEFDADCGERTSKKGNKYEYRNMKSFDQTEDEISVGDIDFIDFSGIDEDDAQKSVAFVGTIDGIYPSNKFKDSELDGEWEFNQCSYPTCDVVFKDESKNVLLTAHFGPWKNAIPFTFDNEDWGFEACPTLDDMVARWIDQRVGIIGYVSSVKENENNEGEEYLYVHVAGGAIFELDDEEIDVKIRSTSRSEKKKSSKKSRVESVVDVQLKQLMNDISNAYKELGSGITVDAIKKGKYLRNKCGDDMIAMAIDVVKSKNVVDEQNDEEEDLPELDVEILKFLERAPCNLTEVKAEFVSKKIGKKKVRVKDVNESVKRLTDLGYVVKTGKTFELTEEE